MFTLNAFDAAGLTFFNKFASFSWLLNQIIINLAQFHEFKGLVIISLLWAACFIPGKDQVQSRQIAFMSVTGGLLSLITARLLTSFLPFRDRPLYNTEFPLDYPLEPAKAHLEHWSAFPSDHAMLWFAISVGIFLISRRLGILAMVYTVVFICLPRIYLGLHHPTDIIGGMVLGTIMVLLFNHGMIRKRFAGPAVNWSFSHPALFSALAFLFSYGLGTHFDALKNFAKPFIYALI